MYIYKSVTGLESSESSTIVLTQQRMLGIIMHRQIDDDDDNDDDDDDDHDDDDDDNQRYLVRVALSNRADKPVALISGSNWNLECRFLWREENRRTRRKTLGAGARTNNKLNPHVTPGPGIEPGPQRWEVSPLTTSPSLLPLLIIVFVTESHEMNF